MKALSGAIYDDKGLVLSSVAWSQRFDGHPDERQAIANRFVQAVELVELIARMKTSMEFEDEMPPEEDWIDTLNELIVSAREIVGKE